jgi:hypothetical protein
VENLYFPRGCCAGIVWNDSRKLLQSSLQATASPIVVNASNRPLGFIGNAQMRFMPPVFGLCWAELTKRYTSLSDAELSSDLPMKAGLWFVGFIINAVGLALLVNLTQIKDISSTVTGKL